MSKTYKDTIGHKKKASFMIGGFSYHGEKLDVVLLSAMGAL